MATLTMKDKARATLHPSAVVCLFFNIHPTNCSLRDSTWLLRRKDRSEDYAQRDEMASGSTLVWKS